MNIRPLFLNKTVSANKTNAMKSNTQTNSINAQPLKPDTVSFGNSEKQLKLNTAGIEQLIAQNDVVIKELEAQKKEKIQDTYRLIALRNNLNKDSSDIGVLKAYGSKVKENEDGTLTISGFEYFPRDITFSDLGIDGDKVFSRVKTVEGNLYSYGTGVENLDSLETIGGILDARCTVKSAKKLKSVNELYIDSSKIQDLPSIKNIESYASLTKSQWDNMKDKLKDNAFFRIENAETMGAIKTWGNVEKLENPVNIDIC